MSQPTTPSGATMSMTRRLNVGLVVGLVAIALLAVPAHADKVADWNQTMLRAALVGSTCPPVTSRVAAIVQAASSTR